MDHHIPKRSSQMALNLFRTILHTIREMFQPQVLPSNTLNPTLLSIGQKCYHIQSQYLRMLDRYSFFTAGPPRYQAYTGFHVVFVLNMIFVSGVVLGLLSLVMSDKEYRGRFWGLVLVQMLLIDVAFAIVWGLEMSDEKRAEGYIWKDFMGRVD